MALLPWASGAQAVCLNSTLKQGESRYEVRETGLVQDRLTQLTWRACSEGQVFQVDGSCAGAATLFTPSEVDAFAKQLAQSQWFGGSLSTAQWRLPNANELSSLVELGCTAPTLNDRVFKATVPTHYWTNGLLYRRHAGVSPALLAKLVLHFQGSPVVFGDTRDLVADVTARHVVSFADGSTSLLFLQVTLLSPVSLVPAGVPVYQVSRNRQPSHPVRLVRGPMSP